MGYVLFHDGQYERAQKIWEAALEKRPEDTILMECIQQARKCSRVISAEKRNTYIKNFAYKGLCKTIAALVKIETERLLSTRQP